jgi:hypothetical protein
LTVPPLDASVRAHLLAPDLAWIEVNHAHALMLLGHADDARQLYLSHRHDHDVDDFHHTWQEAVFMDFGDLRKAGLTDPLMQEIETAYETEAQVAK